MQYYTLLNLDEKLLLNTGIKINQYLNNLSAETVQF